MKRKESYGRRGRVEVYTFGETKGNLMYYWEAKSLYRMISYREPSIFQGMGIRSGRAAYILCLLDSRSGIMRQIKMGIRSSDGVDL